MYIYILFGNVVARVSGTWNVEPDIQYVDPDVFLKVFVVRPLEFGCVTWLILIRCRKLEAWQGFLFLILMIQFHERSIKLFTAASELLGCPCLIKVNYRRFAILGKSI
jgi:hypothetical protein